MEGGNRAHAKKTPRTVTRLMQLHRDNERSRHQGINSSITQLSRRVPGYSVANKETKIVKLQRIINYICHLERNIEALFLEQNVSMECVVSPSDEMIPSDDEVVLNAY